MSINCEVVKDLVAIYKDGVANPLTADEVSAHLKECRDCRQYYRLYDTIHYQQPHASPEPSDQEFAQYAALSARLRRRHRQTVALAAASMAALAGTITVLSILLHKSQRD